MPICSIAKHPLTVSQSASKLYVLVEFLVLALFQFQSGPRVGDTMDSGSDLKL